MILPDSKLLAAGFGMGAIKDCSIPLILFVSGADNRLKSASRRAVADGWRAILLMKKSRR